MMHKNSSDNENYINRTGSHATKEKRTGRIDMIPDWAKEPEEYYNSMRERWDSAQTQFQKCQEQLAEINAKLKTTLPFKEYEFMLERKRAETEKYNSLKDTVAEYRQLARAASEHSVACVFLELAKLRLDKDTVYDLMTDTKAILGRPLQPIAKGRAELDEGQRKHQAARERRQKRRHNFREWYGYGKG